MKKRRDRRKASNSKEYVGLKEFTGKYMNYSNFDLNRDVILPNDFSDLKSNVKLVRINRAEDQLMGSAFLKDTTINEIKMAGLSIPVLDEAAAVPSKEQIMSLFRAGAKLAVEFVNGFAFVNKLGHRVELLELENDQYYVNAPIIGTYVCHLSVALMLAYSVIAGTWLVTNGFVQANTELLANTYSFGAIEGLKLSTDFFVTVGALEWSGYEETRDKLTKVCVSEIGSNNNLKHFEHTFTAFRMLTSEKLWGKIGRASMAVFSKEKGRVVFV